MIDFGKDRGYHKLLNMIYRKEPRGMPRKEKKGRRAYLNDIKMNESGKYVYEGTCYFWKEEGESRCRVLVRLWIL